MTGGTCLHSQTKNDSQNANNVYRLLAKLLVPAAHLPQIVAFNPGIDWQAIYPRGGLRTICEKAGPTWPDSPLHCTLPVSQPQLSQYTWQDSLFSREPPRFEGYIQISAVLPLLSIAPGCSKKGGVILLNHPFSGNYKVLFDQHEARNIASTTIMSHI